MNLFKPMVVAAWALTVVMAHADPPPGYYAATEGKAGAEQSTHLETSTSLPGIWGTVATVPVLTNGNFRVVQTNAVGTGFFRLRVL